MKSLKRLWRTLSTAVQKQEEDLLGKLEEEALDREIENPIDQQMNQIIDNRAILANPAPLKVNTPPKKEFLVNCCVACDRFQGVTLYNVNYEGNKRKACEKHKNLYPRWSK